MSMPYPEQSPGGEVLHIAVIGMTGAGKTTWIKAARKLDVLNGFTKESCTAEMTATLFGYKQKRFMLIDTPGFDGINYHGPEVLQILDDWLSARYGSNVRLAGIIYLHPITNASLIGSSKLNTIMFETLLGTMNLDNLILVTTEWDHMSSATEGEAKERELTQEENVLWGGMVGRGARVARCNRSRDSISAILDLFHSNKKSSIPAKMDSRMYSQGRYDMPEPQKYDTPEQVRDNLVRLNDNLEPSTETFASPNRAFDQLATLVERISRVAGNAEGGGGLASELLQESVQTQKVNELLFDDKQLLQLPTSVYAQLSVVGQKAIAATAACSWDSLLGALPQAADDGHVESGHAALETALEVVQDANQTVKAHLRQYLLESNAFHDTGVLDHVSHLEGGPAADLGLVHDAELRARNIRLRPDLFQSGTDGSGGRPSGQQCSVCAGDDVEEVSGKIVDGANDDFLTFPGQLNNIPIKPLIDTGGGCNLVKLAWIRSQGIEIDPASNRFQSLLMADGSTSQRHPVIDVKWSFDGRPKAWVDVEFVVMEEYENDALIGLPFLKHTETIHNSAGRLVFPEFKGVHAKKKAIPLYNFRKLKASK